jgi:hypothetical protein
MSEKNNQTKTNPQAEKEKRHQQKPWHRKGKHKRRRILKPSLYSNMNFAKLKEAMSKVAFKGYGKRIW